MKELNPNTMFPYALAMGPDMFKKYVDNEELELQGGDTEFDENEFDEKI